MNKTIFNTNSNSLEVQPQCVTNYLSVIQLAEVWKALHLGGMLDCCGKSSSFV